MNPIFFVGAGFMLAVVWIDLKFDWLAAPYRGKPGHIPEEPLSAMAHFYRYVSAKPIVFSIMALLTLGSLILEIVQASVPAWVAWTSLILFVVIFFIAYALAMPNARRLGRREDSLEKQTSLAHSLLVPHIIAIILLLTMIGLQVYAVWGK